MTVGSRNARTVHLRLPVSFFMVRRVVEQGQCIREKSMVQIAVTQVQPFATNNVFISARLSSSKMLPCAMYAIMMIGTTISLAGKPKIKAIRMTPSRPRSFANGSKKFAQWFRRLMSPIITFAMIQIRRPAGMAMITALPSTNRVRSKIERTITFPICGLR